MNILLPFFLVVFVFGNSGQVFALSCAELPESPFESIKEADAVFVGIVKKVERVESGSLESDLDPETQKMKKEQEERINACLFSEDGWKITEIDSEYITCLNEKSGIVFATVITTFPSEITSQRMVTTFKVLANIKGVTQSSIVIYGTAFPVGGTFVVYAHQGEGGLYDSGPCGRTHGWNEGIKELIKWNIKLNRVD